MRRILMVDDDRVVLHLLAEGMRSLGYVVDTAHSADAALALARQERFDLAVLDIRMPGLSGVELAHALKQSGDTPFVFLSAYGDEKVVQEATEAGALGFLTKPVDTPQLMPFIEAAIARGRDIQALMGANDQLERVLHVERKTRMAVGIIMENRKLDSASAFELLRRHARNQRRKVEEVAEELITAMETAYRVMHSDGPPEARQKNTRQ